MYVKALGILLLLAGLIAGIWKLYDAGGDAREDRLVREWQEKELKLVKARDEWRLKAENQIVKDRIIYKDRIHTITQSDNKCIVPIDILRVLADAGIYIGPL